MCKFQRFAVRRECREGSTRIRIEEEKLLNGQIENVKIFR